MSKSFSSNDVEILIDGAWVVAVALSEPYHNDNVFTAEDRKFLKKWRLHVSWEGLVWRWSQTERA